MEMGQFEGNVVPVHKQDPKPLLWKDLTLILHACNLHVYSHSLSWPDQQHGWLAMPRPTRQLGLKMIHFEKMTPSSGKNMALPEIPGTRRGEWTFWDHHRLRRPIMHVCIYCDLLLSFPHFTVHNPLLHSSPLALLIHYHHAPTLHIYTCNYLYDQPKIKK